MRDDSKTPPAPSRAGANAYGVQWRQSRPSIKRPSSSSSEPARARAGLLNTTDLQSTGRLRAVKSC